jgi:hypothetical protein
VYGGEAINSRYERKERKDEERPEDGEKKKLKAR